MMAWFRQCQLKRWRAHLKLDQHECVYQKIFAPVNGFLLSKQARRCGDAFEYTYGEIQFTAFIALLFLVKPDEQTVFYDLGSGIGTAVLACTMVYPVKKSVGIERFAELHHAALQQQQRLQHEPYYHDTAEKIHLIHADFLDVFMDDATLVFINSTGYFGEIWEKISFKLNGLPHLNYVVTLSKPLQCSNFMMIRQTYIDVSWGSVLAYIHQRIEKIL